MPSKGGVAKGLYTNAWTFRTNTDSLKFQGLHSCLTFRPLRSGNHHIAKNSKITRFRALTFKWSKSASLLLQEACFGLTAAWSRLERAMCKCKVEVQTVAALEA